jgi:hypothetical protein
MSRYLKQYEKEHMKMAMLKQEETFKHQVRGQIKNCVCHSITIFSRFHNTDLKEAMLRSGSRTA